MGVSLADSAGLVLRNADPMNEGHGVWISEGFTGEGM